MSGEGVTVGTPAGSRRKWILHGTIWTIVVMVFSFLSSCIALVETPVHFLFGWLFHAVRELPPHLADWRVMLLPLGCLTLATWLSHRFAKWFLTAKGRPQSWRSGHTLLAMSLLILGCAAAIAMSGIIHQSVWLLKAPWLEDRGKKTNLTVAVNNARQLLLAIQEYHGSNGRYPDSLADLENAGARSTSPGWVDTGNGGVDEPFILLHPGSNRTVNADEPLIVSPVIQWGGGRVVIGYGDCSVRSVTVQQFEKILRDSNAEQPTTPAGR